MKFYHLTEIQTRITDTEVKTQSHKKLYIPVNNATQPNQNYKFRIKCANNGMDILSNNYKPLHLE